MRLTDGEGRQEIGEIDAAAPVMRALLDTPAVPCVARVIRNR